MDQIEDIWNSEKARKVNWLKIPSRWSLITKPSWWNECTCVWQFVWVTTQPHKVNTMFQATASTLQCPLFGQHVSLVLHTWELADSALDGRREVVCESGTPCCWSLPADERERGRGRGTGMKAQFDHNSLANVCCRNRKRERERMRKIPITASKAAAAAAVTVHNMQHLAWASIELASHVAVNVEM